MTEILRITLQFKRLGVPKAVVSELERKLRKKCVEIEQLRRDFVRGYLSRAGYWCVTRVLIVTPTCTAFWRS
eukprot:1959596-Pleurochrysis_carterae.AAC.1